MDVLPAWTHLQEFRVGSTKRQPVFRVGDTHPSPTFAFHSSRSLLLLGVAENNFGSEIVQAMLDTLPRAALQHLGVNGPCSVLWLNDFRTTTLACSCSPILQTTPCHLP